MDFGFYGVFIIAGVLAVQFFFSTRNNPYWGVVIPILYTAFLTWMYITHQIESMIKFILLLIIGILFLIAEWRSGRKYVREKRKKELDKMRAFDMK